METELTLLFSGGNTFLITASLYVCLRIFHCRPPLGDIYIDTFQPRQEELLEYVFANCDDEQLEQMKKLFIDLSPWSKGNKKSYDETYSLTQN